MAVLSMHTSPLAQPGTGDGGGMNVYVRQLSSALARRGVACDVYTRSWSAALPSVVEIEPGLKVHHVPAGPLVPLRKEELPDVVADFTQSVLERIGGSSAERPDVLHAHYWLSGLAGHVCKHELGVPLISTFHTLDRVKAAANADETVAESHRKAAGGGQSDEESALETERRALAEAQVIGCSDAVLASCTVEAMQLADLYGADPNRIKLVPPGVESAIFSPGDRAQARRAVGVPHDKPLLLFVGRIQPLKGAELAVHALSQLADRHEASLAVIGGPSGPSGYDTMAELHRMVGALGLEGRVRFVQPQSHELLSSWYRAADVCLVPSRSESFGLVALEAAACGTPVVASAVGGLNTLVEHQRTGFLVEHRDARRFAAQAQAILDDPLLAASMSSAASRRALRYTWSAAADSLCSVYESLVGADLVECA
ncbi:MAG: glycosyltransferase [Actinomycetota bacterium]|nr:glycosyltransferase [Actinomycetota bacterium]